MTALDKTAQRLRTVLETVLRLALFPRFFQKNNPTRCGSQDLPTHQNVDVSGTRPGMSTKTRTIPYKNSARAEQNAPPCCRPLYVCVPSSLWTFDLDSPPERAHAALARSPSTKAQPHAISQSDAHPPPPPSIHTGQPKATYYVHTSDVGSTSKHVGGRHSAGLPIECCRCHRGGTVWRHDDNKNIRVQGLKQSLPPTSSLVLPFMPTKMSVRFVRSEGDVRCCTHQLSLDPSLSSVVPKSANNNQICP